ncbi:hypothetical protein PR048_009111 [Dryococelus australis]|uniref:Uncharacterized protein n=1 Tax=Dryococelus australis TaxID=614101 RepID=A0ABQ9HZR9_9NEOP|nr:hypothetical protein PR048_009111 [Dryococelus australis]
MKSFAKISSVPIVKKSCERREKISVLCRKFLLTRKEAAKSCRAATLQSSPKRRTKTLTLGKVNNGVQDYGELATQLNIEGQ